MRITACLSTVALAASVILAGNALAIDPPGSTPSSTPTPQARDTGPSFPQPAPQRGPTQFGADLPVPPPAPLGFADPSADDDAEIDALLGIGVPLPPPSSTGPQSLASGGPGYQELLETTCSWGNDNVATCIVWDCDADGVCTGLGQYCVDHNGHQVPCP